MATGFEALMGVSVSGRPDGADDGAGGHGLKKMGELEEDARSDWSRRKHVRYEELTIEGRNAVLEAFRSGKTIDQLFVLDGCKDGPVKTIVREARKQDTVISYVPKERLDQIVRRQASTREWLHMRPPTSTRKWRICWRLAREKGEPPFLFLLDGIEDPHNLGAIIRTANLAGAHGVIIPKRRAVGLTATVAKTSAGLSIIRRWQR